MDAEHIATGWLATNTMDYWLDVCARAVASCDTEERWCKEHGHPVPSWVHRRRQEYMAMDEALCKRLASDQQGDV